MSFTKCNVLGKRGRGQYLLTFQWQNWVLVHVTWQHESYLWISTSGFVRNAVCHFLITKRADSPQNDEVCISTDMQIIRNLRKWKIVPRSIGPCRRYANKFKAETNQADSFTTLRLPYFYNLRYFHCWTTNRELRYIKRIQVLTMTIKEEESISHYSVKFCLLLLLHI